MPSPQNNQGFVQPSSGGTGNWLSKLFGGISDSSRSRSMAQLQLDLHAGKADVDTFHRKERSTWEMATKDAGAELAYDRSGREIERGIEAGPRMGDSKLKGFDSAGRPILQASGLADRGDKADTEATDLEVDTPTQTAATVSTPPTDRADNPARKAKTRNATLKDTTAALSAGKIDQEQAAEMSPTYARNLGKKTASDSITNPDSAATPAKVRKPRTPKADA
jgi:hypothetical protein